MEERTFELSGAGRTFAMVTREPRTRAPRRRCLRLRSASARTRSSSTCATARRARSPTACRSPTWASRRRATTSTTRRSRSIACGCRRLVVYLWSTPPEWVHSIDDAAARQDLAGARNQELRRS